MKITLQVLAEELTKAFPTLTVRSDEKQSIKQAVLLTGSNLAEDSQTLYICPTGSIPDSFPEQGCALLVGKPQSPLSLRNYILIPGDTVSPQEVLSTVQDILLRFFLWYAEMLQISSQGTDFQSLVDGSGHLFPRGVGFLSVWHPQGVFSEKSRLSPSQWEEIFQPACTPEKWSENSAFLSAELHQTLQAPHFHTFASNGSCLFCNVFCHGMRAGMLVTELAPREARRAHALCLSVLANCAERMLETLLSTQHDAFAKALLRMIHGDSVSDSKLTALCQQEGWSSSGHTFRVMVIRAEQKVEESFRREQLFYQKAVASIYYKSRVLLYQDEIVVVRDFTVHDAFEEGADSFDRLNQFLKQSHATMGASAPFSNLSQLRLFYEQARTLATASENTATALHEYSNYLFFDVIHSFAASHPLHQYIHPDVRRLALHEREGNSDLLLSLYLYLLNDKSYQLCAKKLNIHRNSFAYRIGKVLDLISCDLSNENVRLSILLSICMYWYQHPEKDPIGISHWNQG